MAIVTVPDPPFSTIAIAGFGLIGGSIALGVRERWPSCRIVGVDRPAVLAHAFGSGALDRGVNRLSEAGNVDLIVLAAPVSQNVRLLEESASLTLPHTVITDVGGTKRDIVAAARALPQVTFVAGHPIGGAERGGFGFARPDLFQRRPWIFTPHAHSPDAVARLFALARGLGAEPTMLDADEHDQLMAYLSHLTQLTATALMCVAGKGAAAAGLNLAGRGLLDTTRLASSPASVWTDICRTNADLIGVAIDQLIETLRTMRSGLDDAGQMEQLFSEANRWRAELIKRGQ